MTSAVAPVVGAVLLGSILAGCAHRVVCEPPPVANADSIWHASGGPLQFVLDSTVPPDSVVIVVLDSVRRKPIIGAGARFLPTTSADARADGSGRIALALPAGEHAILEVDAIGFMRRRDTLALGAVRNHKVEAVLAYPTGGDIDVVVCHR